MAMALSSADQRQLVKTLEAMLSPLASPSPEAWFKLIMREMQSLCGGDSALLCVQHESRGRHFSDDAPALALRMDALSRFDAGEFHFNDSHLDSGMVLRRERSVSAFTSAQLDVLTGGTYYGSEFYNDVAVPLGAETTMGLAVSASAGEAILGINRVGLARDFLDEAALDLLTLVLPAFRAGFEVLSRMETSRQSLASAFDTLSEGMMICDRVDGRELYRNASLGAMLAADPEREQLVVRMIRLARGVNGLARSATRASPGVVPLADEIRTTRGVYLLRLSFLAPGAFARETTALVAVEAPPKLLPSAAVLRERFRLTVREAEIALVIAKGASDIVVADQLGISPHTVRHHMERVFDKVGVRTRKALALHLVEERNVRARRTS